MRYEAYAVKSAEAVAARLPSEDRRPCQHAPLCPRNVPILSCINIETGYQARKAHQSPVDPSRSIGLLSIAY